MVTVIGEASALSVRQSPVTASLTTRCDPGSPAFVRSWAGRLLDLLVPDVSAGLLGDVQLVLSELVTNAMRARSSSIAVSLSRASSRLRISVLDDADGLPEIRRPGAAETSGRGLVIIAAVAENWGVQAADPGKEVWADLVLEGATLDEGDESPGRGLGLVPEPAALIAPPSLRSSAESRDVTDSVLGDLLEQARRILQTDTAAVLLFDEAEQFLVAVAARGIEEEVRQGTRVRPGAGFAGRIAAERRPVVLETVTPETVVNPLLWRKGIRTMLGVPLLAGSRALDGEARVLGVMHVGNLRPRDFGHGEIATLERIGQRVAAAVTRHRAFADRAAASALQHSLAPRLPEVPGLELAARYVPGGQHGVGGDWYDIFTLPSGRVGITVGDVMGHGLAAATVMGRLRSVVRAYALEDEEPAGVLQRVDRATAHFEPGQRVAATHAVLDPADGTLTLSAAGSLPPALVGPDGHSRLLDPPVDPPLGLGVGSSRRHMGLTLAVGARLCLFSDGLLDRRRGPVDEQLSRVCESLDATSGAPAEIVGAELMTAMLGDQHPDDDVSLLVVGRTA